MSINSTTTTKTNFNPPNTTDKKENIKFITILGDDTDTKNRHIGTASTNETQTREETNPLQEDRMPHALPKTTKRYPAQPNIGKAEAPADEARPEKDTNKKCCPAFHGRAPKNKHKWCTP